MYITQSAWLLLHFSIGGAIPPFLAPLGQIGVSVDILVTFVRLEENATLQLFFSYLQGEATWGLSAYTCCQNNNNI